jgi:DNA invertase Pin-like site-specific DNA recombinase
MKRAVPKHDTWDAGYVRVSTEMQVERDALQNQIQALEGYGAAHGLTLRIYKDEGISAKDTDRPDLQRLLADVRAGRVRAVLVTKLDRISRSLVDLLDLMRLFEQHGVKFVSLRDNIDTSGPVGRFMLHILGAIAELERGITAERVAEDMKLRARRGKWNGGLVPYGRQVGEWSAPICSRDSSSAPAGRRCTGSTATSRPSGGATAWATTAAEGPATKARAPRSRSRRLSWSASSSTSCVVWASTLGVSRRSPARRSRPTRRASSRSSRAAPRRPPSWNASRAASARS